MLLSIMGVQRTVVDDEEEKTVKKKEYRFTEHEGEITFTDGDTMTVTFDEVEYCEDRVVFYRYVPTEPGCPRDASDWEWRDRQKFLTVERSEMRMLETVDRREAAIVREKNERVEIDEDGNPIQ